MQQILYDIWENLEDYICNFLLTIIVGLLMCQVLYRYIGGSTIIWSEEVSRFAFLYLVYFAASLATRKNLHIRVTAHLKFLPKKMQVGLLLVTDILWLGFTATVVYLGIEFIQGMETRPMLSGALLLDMRFVFFAVPLAFALQSIRLIERWVHIATGRKKCVIPSEEVF